MPPLLPPDFSPAALKGLHLVDACDAFKVSVQAGHLPVKDLARLMGWSESFARRVFSTEKFYPSFEDLPKFCATVGNMVILQWLLAKATMYGLRPEHQSVDCRALLLRVTDIFTEVGDVATEARAAVQDNRLSAAELRRILSCLQMLLEDGMALTGDLRAILEDKGSSAQGAARG